MNIADFAIDKRVIVWTMIILFFVGGIFAYFNLGRYEDPEFTIKDAKVVTFYPGATPMEVEEEVTDRLEKAIHQLSQIKRTTSVSKNGFSEITVTIKDKYDKESLPQVWDELRRKVHDVQQSLPPGAGPTIVYDDFGDVYGMLYAITGAGFSYRELKKYSDIIKRELEMIPGVAKAGVTGTWQEAIFTDISSNRMSQLGISLEEIYATLGSQNTVVNAGQVRVGDEYIIVRPSGEVSSVDAIRDLIIGNSESGSLVYLSDIADVTRGYIEVPNHLIYYNGEAALSLGISIVSGGNVVKIGDAVQAVMDELDRFTPAGIEIHPIYEQPESVDASIKNFLVSLIEALLIVVVVLLFAMGLRSGLIIAGILALTVMGTLFFMYLYGIALERISLGALIIALGMLVDNAIVVTEGIQVKIERGEDRRKASRTVLQQTLWPLLGATFIGIIAFAPIGLSEDATGEYTRSLFSVITISLLLSWVLAVIVAPLFCYFYIKAPLVKESAEQSSDAYQHWLYQYYHRVLDICLKFRWPTVFIMVGLLLAASFAFTQLKEGFFPDSTTPIFLVDYWRAEGTDIRATRDDMLKLEQQIAEFPGVVNVTALVGQGAQRFMLVYEPESPNMSYGQFLIEVEDYRLINALAEDVRELINTEYTDAELKIRMIRLGPGKGSKIEVRFSGDDPQILRQLSNQAQDIFRAHPLAQDVRDDWRQRVKIVQPRYSEQQGRLTGISREGLSEALQMGFSGFQVGLYREKDELIPIISRPPDQERLNVASAMDMQVWSPSYERVVPLMQVAPEITTGWEDPQIRRRNRKRTVTASAEPLLGVEGSVVLNDVMPQVEALPLPPGFVLEWGGEYESANDARAAIAQSLPVGFLVMFLIVVLLFNAIKQPLIIWACVPLSIIGVAFGLLVMNKAFDFMGLLGFLSLIGMLIKNAIVLVDQIDLERHEGKVLHEAIIDSAMSRARPVVLAALTTVLGMLPLLQDPFFISMAIVIMAGLSFATILTLVFVPVLYSLFFSSTQEAIPKFSQEPAS